MATRNKWRSRLHWEFGDHCGYRLASLGLPTEACPTAAATCQVYLHGLNTNGNEWGNGARAWLQTRGHALQGMTNCYHQRRDWVEVDSHASVDALLSCFDITLDEVYDEWGKPKAGEKLTLDLYCIVNTLRPGIIVNDAMLASPDERTHAAGRQAAMALT